MLAWIIGLRIVKMSFWKTVSTALVGLLFSKEVCYKDEGIGCFSNKSPYNNVQGLLPQSPSKIQVEFLLYKRRNQNLPQDISRDPSRIKLSNYIGSKNTKIIIHGYKTHARKSWVLTMKDALLKKEDCNVITVNWEKGAKLTDYRQAAANSRVVGAMIAELMKALHKTSKASYDSMHLIGHSLGAHIAGYAGERVPGTGRITGLDPAGFLFENQDPKVRLDPSDANFVDVIHTDGDSLSELGFGLEQAIGDADFYPNGGTDQPGCTDKWYKHLFSLVSGTVKDLKKSVSCSHDRSQQLFTESITSTCTFTAFPCASDGDFKAGKCKTCQYGCATMGYNADRTKRGKFYLATSIAAPYCRTSKPT